MAPTALTIPTSTSTVGTGLVVPYQKKGNILGINNVPTPSKAAPAPSPSGAHEASPPTRGDASSTVPTPSKAAPAPSPSGAHDAPPTTKNAPRLWNHILGYKELAVSPGRLGIIIEFNAGEDGAVIKVIGPKCTFRDKIQLGDRIVSIDGRALTKSADLQIGNDRSRIFGIIPLPIANALLLSIQHFTGTNKMTKASSSILTQHHRILMQQQQQQQQSGKRKRDSLPTNVQQISPGEVARQTAPAKWRSQLNQQNSMNMKNLNQQNCANLAAQTEIAQAYANLAAQTEIDQANEKRDQASFNTWRRVWDLHQTEMAKYYRKRHGDGWEQKFQELVRYRGGNEENARDWNNVPLDYRDPDDITLGEWVVKQRELYLEGKLDKERVSILEDVGFDWLREPPNDRYTGDEEFDKKLRELIAYKKEFLNTDVPLNYPEGESLGQWVARQRRLYDEGALGEEQNIVLETLGFVFEPGTNVELTVVRKEWKRNFAELKQYKRDYGHLDVPSHYKAHSMSVQLGKWITQQRNLFKKKELSKNHIRIFNEIGLDLSVRKFKALSEDKWDNTYNKLLEYMAQHGHPNPTRNEGPLGWWARTQRNNYRKGELTERRIQRLNEIGFNWNPTNKAGGCAIASESVIPPANKDEPTTPLSVFTSQAWISNYEALKLYMEENRHADIPHDYEDPNVEGSLFTWLETQKHFYEEGNLPQHNIDVLEEIGVDLSDRYDANAMSRTDAAWMKNYQIVKQYKDDHGNTEIPFGYHSDKLFGGFKCLATWVQRQKDYHRRGKLSEERSSLLQSLGMNLNRNKKSMRRKDRTTTAVLVLGETPEDTIWFQGHDDGSQRRVPTHWEFPLVTFEQMYVYYHCRHEVNGQEQNCQVSPMKMFVRPDMAQGTIYKRHLNELKQICSRVDTECIRRGVVIDGFMTEEQAKQSLQIGYPALNIPPFEDGTPRNVPQMKWRSVFRMKRPYIPGDEVGNATEPVLGKDSHATENASENDCNPAEAESLKVNEVANPAPTVRNAGYTGTLPPLLTSRSQFSTFTALATAVTGTMLRDGMHPYDMRRNTKESFSKDLAVESFGRSNVEHMGDIIPIPKRGVFQCKGCGKGNNCTFNVGFTFDAANYVFADTEANPFCLEHNHPPTMS